MIPKDVITEAGFSDVLFLSNYSYDSALVGVTTDNRAVYSFSKMVDWLMTIENFTREDAEDWIYYNTIRSMKYFGPSAPIIMYDVEDYM